MKICNQGFLLVCLIFSFLKVSPVIGNDRADSIRTELGSGVSDTAAIWLFTQLAAEFETMDRNQPDSALFYLNKALALTEKTSYSKHLYTIYEKYSKVFSGSGNYSLALDYYFKMLSLLDNEVSVNNDTISLYPKYARLYAQIGLCYFNMDNFKALNYYLTGDYKKTIDLLNKAMEEYYP